MKGMQIGRWTAAALILALAIPLLWPGLPPLIDLPGHVGRYRIQLDIDHSAYLSQYFQINWRILPNLGVDLLVMALAPLMGLEPAVKAIVICIPVLTGAGFLLIAREIHGRIPPTALFALPLVYGWPFQAGFVNYALSMALATLAFGFWLRLGRLGHLRLRTALFLPIAPLLWIAHVHGWLVLCVLVGVSGFVQRLNAGDRLIMAGLRTALACLPLALPLVMIIVWREQSAGTTGGWFDWRMFVTWSMTLLRDRWQALDAVSALLLYALAFAPLLFRRSLAFDWRLAAPAFVLWMLALFIPNALSGSFYAGVRIIPFAMAMTLLAIRVRPETSLRTRHIIFAAAALFFVVRLGAQTIDYIRSDARNAENLAALDQVPRGARIATLVGQTCGRWLPARHLLLPQLATARREAFTNGHWATSAGQALTIRYRKGAPFVADPSQFVNVSGCGTRFPSIQTSFPKIPLSAFDYVWIVEVPSVDWPKSPRLQPVWNNGSSILYRVTPGAGSAR